MTMRINMSPTTSAAASAKPSSAKPQSANPPSQTAARQAGFSQQELNDIQQHHLNRQKEMNGIREKLKTMDDESPQWGELVSRYKQLVYEETRARDQMADRYNATEKANPELNKQFKGTDTAMKNTIYGNDDGIEDGRHDFGKARHLTRIDGQGDSMLRSAYEVWGENADDARTARLNPEFDDRSVDGRSNTPREQGLRDGDHVVEGEWTVTAANSPDAVPVDSAVAQPSGFLSEENRSYAQKNYDYVRLKTSLTPEQDAKVHQLLFSSEITSYNPTVRRSIAALITDDPNRLDGIDRLARNLGFQRSNDPEWEMRLLNRYRNDSAFASNVDKLTEQNIALDQVEWEGQQ